MTLRFESLLFRCNATILVPAPHVQVHPPHGGRGLVDSCINRNRKHEKPPHPHSEGVFTSFFYITGAMNDEGCGLCSFLGDQSREYIPHHFPEYTRFYFSSQSRIMEKLLDGPRAPMCQPNPIATRVKDEMVDPDRIFNVLAKGKPVRFIGEERIAPKTSKIVNPTK